MQIKGRDTFDPRFNVTLRVYDRQKDGSLAFREKRDVHNVMTNAGRTWLMQTAGASSYDPLTPLVTEKVQYVGFGCGGYLQNTPGLALLQHTQTELASVISLEEPVALSYSGQLGTFLRSCQAQTLGNTDDFPGPGRIVFRAMVAESELSFTDPYANYALRSSTQLGTEVPVSEAGLYLSSAVPTYNTGSHAGADPRLANHMVCYNVFDPVIVTPNVMLMLEWELRC